jgi:hypothetical protein
MTQVSRSSVWFTPTTTFYDTFSGAQNGTSFGNNDRDSSITTSSDLGFTISKSFGPVNLNAGYYYDFRIGGQYIESSADCPIEVTSHFSVVPSVSVGYGLDYYSFAGNFGPSNPNNGPGKRDGFTAVRPALSFPIKVTETATFTPYAAMNLSGPLVTTDDRLETVTKAATTSTSVGR